MFVKSGELSSPGHLPACKHTLIPKKLLLGIRPPAQSRRLNLTHDAVGQSATVKVGRAPTCIVPSGAAVLSPIRAVDCTIYVSTVHGPALARLYFVAKDLPDRRGCTSRNSSRRRKSVQKSANPMWSLLEVRDKGIRAGMRATLRRCTASSRCKQPAVRHI